MATGQTTTAGTETDIEEEAAIEETTGEDISKGIIMAMTEADTEEAATLAVAEGAAEDIEEMAIVIYNSIETVHLREAIILKEMKPCREIVMGTETPTALITNNSSLKSLLIPLRRSRKISTW